jgi:dolichol-phosphate mannosyltransferase
MCEISFVFPSYLEEENLRIILPRLNAAMKTAGISYETLVVDTVVPMDNTAGACAEHRAAYVNRTPGNAYGDAVRSGIARAKGSWIVFMDADGSHSPEVALRLLAERKDYDVVIASRYVPGGAVDNKRSLVLMSILVNRIFGFVLGIRCRDISNSFKAYRAELLKPMVLECDNFDVIEEILYKLFRKHPSLRVKEIPFTFKERMFGHTKRKLILFMLTYFFTLLKLKFMKTEKG